MNHFCSEQELCHGQAVPTKGLEERVKRLSRTKGQRWSLCAPAMSQTHYADVGVTRLGKGTRLLQGFEITERADLYLPPTSAFARLGRSFEGHFVDQIRVSPFSLHSKKLQAST